MDNIHFPKAVFFAPGEELVDDLKVTSRVVSDADALEQALADGWHETAAAAAEAHQAKLDAQKPKSDDENRAPTRAELEQKATELGIPFKAQTSNKKLADEIAAKLAEAAQ